MTIALVIVVQVTLILALANVAARWVVARAPQLAAVVCLIGFVMAMAVILLTLVPIPRIEIESLIGSATHVKSSGDQGERTASSDATQDRPLVAAGDFGGIELRRLREQLTLGSYRETAAVRSLVRFCLLAWGLLVGLGMLRNVISAFMVLPMRQLSREIHIPRLAQSLSAWQAEHRAGVSLKLFTSDHVDSPCVTWLDRGAIYVPETFAEWSEEEQLAVVAHEAAHLLRCDAQWRLFASLTCQVLNFHPLAWLLKRQLVLAQELAADRWASELLSVVAYRRGLCQLALRMDSEVHAPFVSFGVSVSTNSLVRRIKVLKSMKSKLSRWQQCLAVTLFVGGGLGVAVWTVHADDTLRIASRSAQPATQPADWFARGASCPWDEVGDQSGYCRMLPSTMARNKLIQSSVDGFAQQIGVGELQSDVRLSRDWDLFVSNFEWTVKDQSESHQQHDHRYAMSVNVDKFAFQFSRDVDWVEVAEKLDLGRLVTEENYVWLRGYLKSAGISRSIRLGTGDTSAENDCQVVRSLWSVVDGGVTTIVFPLAEALKIDPTYNSDDVIHAAWLAVAQRCRFAGVGIDCSQDAATCQLRLALVPNQDCSAQEVLEQVEAAIVTTLASLDEDSAASEVERQKVTHLRSMIDGWRVSTRPVDATIEEVVVIEGAVVDLNLWVPMM